MPHINDDIPIDEYVEHRPVGGLKHKLPRRYDANKHLTVMINFLVSPKIKKNIDKLIENQIFPEKAEFFRYLIIKFFEEHKEWLK